jgi:Raf kinase inhibitor-like YbhB/YbcL family protein
MSYSQRYFLAAIFFLSIDLATTEGCGPEPRGGAALPLKLKSSDFASGAMIPKQFTCDGADSSPALEWSDPPGGTQSFALIVDDPDAPVGTWVHWVVFDLPANLRALARSVPRKEEMGDGSRQGRNDFGKIGYGGPCPPAGAAHRYFFKIYALDTKLNLKPGATKADVERAKQGHVLAEGEWMGRYSR